MTAKKKKPAGGARLMSVGYARVMRILHDGVNGELVDKINLREAIGYGSASQTSCRMLRYFHQCGLTHVAAWRTGGNVKKRWIPMYRLGPGQDVPCPGKFPSGLNYLRVRSEFLAFAAVIEAMERDEHNVTSLSAYLGVSQWYSRRLLRAMHELRLIHITGYTKTPSGGDNCPMYMFGIDAKDQPKSYLTEKELARKRNKAHWQKTKQLVMIHRTAGAMA